MNKIIKKAKEIVDEISSKKPVNPYDKKHRAAASIVKSLAIVAQTKEEIKTLKKEVKEKKNIVEIEKMHISDLIKKIEKAEQNKPGAPKKIATKNVIKKNVPIKKTVVKKELAPKLTKK